LQGFQEFSLDYSLQINIFLSVQDVESTQERTIAQLQLGAAPKKRKPKYVTVNEALQRLGNNTFGGRLPNVQQIMSYLDAAAYLLWDVKH
jgi:hypothetical protein